MNKDRRLRIRSVIQTIQECADTVSSIRDEEEMAMDGLPENLQYSDRYTAMEDAAGYLESAESALEEAVQNLEDAASQ